MIVFMIWYFLGLIGFAVAMSPVYLHERRRGRKVSIELADCLLLPFFLFAALGGPLMLLAGAISVAWYLIGGSRGLYSRECRFPMRDAKCRLNGDHRTLGECIRKSEEIGRQLSATWRHT